MLGANLTLVLPDLIESTLLLNPISDFESGPIE